MALRTVVVEGDEILRKKCKEVKEITPRLLETLEDMVETMRSECGVGIAAPQIGIMRRYFVAEPDPESGKVYYMINPEILEYGEETETAQEGCLSVPGMAGDVERPTYIKLRALCPDGKIRIYEFHDFEARVMQHEYDHLDGILYTDKASNVFELTDEDYEETEEE